ncbi:ABC transporter permease subunit, partial [Streptomyces sp. NPDC052015]|uniref:ABC transporter permease subunit n=1 Tax=Streptomyces sp. NPDC052015 TaxID=3154755 RepID=UPI00342C0ADA
LGDIAPEAVVAACAIAPELPGLAVAGDTTGGFWRPRPAWARGRVTIFRRIYLPLVGPGLASAGLLSFILSLGYYITPALMGGPNQTMIATLINQQVTRENQWNGAAAQGVILLVLTLAGLLLVKVVSSLGASRKKRSAT